MIVVPSLLRETSSFRSFPLEKDYRFWLLGSLKGAPYLITYNAYGLDRNDEPDNTKLTWPVGLRGFEARITASP
jgi:hypothetical protein